MHPKSKCPKCGKVAVEFVQECETAQMVCGGPTVYFCSSDMVYEYMMGGLEESDAKERLAQDYGCGHIVSQGYDPPEGWIETLDRGAAEFLIKELTYDNGTIGDTYHKPNGSHPPTCRGCTLDESRHGKPILSAPWVVKNKVNLYWQTTHPDNGRWTTLARATRYVSQADAAKVAKKVNGETIHEMNAPDVVFEKLAPIDRIALARQADEERHQQIRGFCLEQGLVLVQESPRKYIVIKVSGGSRTLNGSVYGGNDHEGKWYAHLSGDIVFRGKYDEVHKYLCDNGLVLPDDLRPR